MTNSPYPAYGIGGHLLGEKPLNLLRFEEAERLLGEAAKLIDETGREELHGSLALLTAQVTRAAHTFEAVLANCRLGRGVQGSMLNRSLFEDVLDIHWVAENQEIAPDRAEEHDRLTALAEHAIEIKFEHTDRELTEAEQTELNQLIGGLRRPGARVQGLLDPVVFPGALCSGSGSVGGGAGRPVLPGLHL